MMLIAVQVILAVFVRFMLRKQIMHLAHRNRVNHGYRKYQR